MGKLCNRCRVPGCCLDYLGAACKKARAEYCPDVVLTRFEEIQDVWTEEDFVNAFGGDSRRMCGVVGPDHCRAQKNCDVCFKDWLASPAEMLPIIYIGGIKPLWSHRRSTRSGPELLLFVFRPEHPRTPHMFCYSLHSSCGQSYERQAHRLYC